MRFNATLCTTDRNEPWAANVNMAVSRGEITFTLKTNYTHYENVTNNSNVVVVYKNPSLEIILKATAVIGSQKEGVATVTLTPSWLRLVENGSTSDTTSSDEIATLLAQRINS